MSLEMSQVHENKCHYVFDSDPIEMCKTLKQPDQTACALKGKTELTKLCKKHLEEATSIRDLDILNTWL